VIKNWLDVLLKPYSCTSTANISIVPPSEWVIQKLKVAILISLPIYTVLLVWKQCGLSLGLLWLQC